MTNANPLIMLAAAIVKNAILDSHPDMVKARKTKSTKKQARWAMNGSNRLRKKNYHEARKWINEWIGDRPFVRSRVEYLWSMPLKWVKQKFEDEEINTLAQSGDDQT